MKTRRAKGRLTLAQAMEIIPATCAKCGGRGRIYPYPVDRGTMVCPHCSPAWLDSFVAFATKALRQELGVAS